MISCQLKGGFGNVLFQYAATIAYASKANTKPNFPNFTHHLDYLNNYPYTNPPLNHAEEYRDLLLAINEEKPQIDMVYQFPFEYVEFEVPKFSLIDGFFQSEKYFKSHRKQILESIKIGVPENWKGFNFEDFTSVHVRRGDYIKFQDHHTVLSETSYYDDALKILNEENYLIFSDDKEWCKNNFKNKNFVFVEEKDYYEIKMMSLCKNNIIANSSFSWWGAWLNEREDKKVIAPINWFGPKINHGLQDLIPENWIKV